jgi:hypothetical protein
MDSIPDDLLELQAREFGTLNWVHPSFRCKSDFLLFIMDEY